MFQPHCVDKFNATFSSFDWCSLSFFGIHRSVIHINWKIAHGVLYAAQRLVSFGSPVPLPCFCGALVETLEHLFFYCPLAQSILSWLQSLMFVFSSMSPILSLRQVLFGISSDELIAASRIFVYLLNLSKFCIWKSRNDCHFRNTRPDALAVMANILSRLKFHLPILFKRFKSDRRRRFFHRQWGARGVVSSVVNSSLVFSI